jgi:hypothetical protein
MRHRVALALLVVLAACAKQESAPPAASTAPPPPARGSREWLIQTALSAAPPSISGHATLIDMNAKVDSLKTLRAGTNGWVCAADDTTEHHMGPICVDGQWQKWLTAWMGHKPFTATSVGIAYMLAGSNDASNTDPFATKPDSGKGWVVTGPHVMILAPGGAHAYDGIAHEATDPSIPYVMFPGTPYAHIMSPVGGHAAN